MRLLLDTNRYSDYLKGDAAVVKQLENAAEVFLPFVVLAELHVGFMLGTKLRENQTALEKFLRRPGVSLLCADSDTTLQFAAVLVQLRRQGTPIPIHDMWIAALAIQHQLPLFARDAHFDHLPQVQRI